MTRAVFLFAACFLLLTAFSSLSAEPQENDPPARKQDISDGKNAALNVVVKRRHDWTDEDLRRQLVLVPDTGLGQATAAVI